MVDYLVMRIKQHKLKYEEVIEKYPQYKDEIDAKLGKN
jgi:hypothetical protein